ncbi:MAG: branched-chain amino acid ABC transporter permease [Mycobacteriales bacterium]|nr:branched-chain amino acid ABC transporter permease [Mycobacteriales bacterium]
MTTAPAPTPSTPFGVNDLKKLGTGLLLGLLAALITGPVQGTADAPTRAFRGAILDGRVVLYLLLGLAIGAVLVAKDRGLLDNRLPKVQPVVAVQNAMRNDRRLFWAALVLAALFAILFPLTLEPFWQRVLASQIAIYVLLALGLNVVVGLAGLLDLGYIAFFAIGAYTTAYFTGKLPVEPPFILNPFFVVPFAVLIAALSGVVLGGPTLRLRGDYLAIVTLGFGEIVRILLVNGDKAPFTEANITNGPRGAAGIPHPSIDLGFWSYDWKLGQLPYYYLLLVVIIIVVILFRNLEESRVGRAWTAIREDEVAAGASGVPTVKFKLLAFSIGASTSGLAGVFYATNIGFIAPDQFLFLASILVLTMVIFGGMGSIIGVIAGAAVLQWLPNALRDYVAPEDRYIYFGVLLVIMMIFRPQGLIPSKRRARELKMSEAGIGGADSLGSPTGTAGSSKGAAT